MTMQFGADPTKDNVEFVKKNAAINQSTILPVWAKDTLVVLPNQKVDPQKVDISQIFKADVVTDSDDLSVYVDITKQNRKEGMNAENKKSMKEVMNIKSPTFFQPVRMNYQTDNLAREVWPLVDSLDVLDLTHKHFLALMYIEKNEEDMMFDVIQGFQHSLTGYVPFLKDTRRLGEESSEIKLMVTQTLSNLIATPLFIQFYEALYVQCCEKILLGISKLGMERLSELNRRLYLELSSPKPFSPSLSKIEEGTKIDRNNSNSQADNDTFIPSSSSMSGRLELVDIEDVMRFYEQCMTILHSKLAFKVFALKAANQGFVYATTFVVLELLRTNYKWLRPEMKYNEDVDLLRKHVNKMIIDMITQLVDPYRLYPMEFFFLRKNETMDPTIEKKFIDRRPIKNMKGKQYMTSLPIRAIFSKGASTAETRKMLQMTRGSDEPTNLCRIKEKISGSRDNGAWKVPPHLGTRLPTPKITDRKRESRAKTAKPQTRPVYRNTGVVDVLTEIDDLFNTYDNKLKERCSSAKDSFHQHRQHQRQGSSSTNVKRAKSREGGFLSVETTCGGDDNNNNRSFRRTGGFSSEDFSDMFVATPTEEPKLSPLKRTELFNMTLEKVRTPFIGKHEKKTEVEMFGPIEESSPHWSSKSTRTGKPEVGNTALIRFPTRPPSRETPIIPLDGRKTAAPSQRFKLPL